MANPTVELTMQVPTPSLNAGRNRLRSAAAAGAGDGDGELSRYVRLVASMEKAGNALGALAFMWATVIVLGGFPTVLTSDDFWYATGIVILEAARMRNGRDYRCCHALTPWNPAVVILYLASFLLYKLVRTYAVCLPLILTAILLKSQFSALKLASHGPLRRALLLWSPSVAVIFLISVSVMAQESRGRLLRVATVVLPLFVVVLVLTVSKIRHPRITRLASSSHGRKLLLSARVVLAACMLAATVVSVSLFGPRSLAVPPAVALLSFGNLQVRTSALRLVLASFGLACIHGPYGADRKSEANLVRSLTVFYVLALCQGTLHVAACVLGLLSFFPRGSLVRRCGFRGRWGAQSVDRYYDHAYDKCMEERFIAPEKMSLAAFAIQSLSSDSRAMQLTGLRILHGFLKHGEHPNLELISRITTSRKTMATLISMLGWTVPEDTITRLFAAKVAAELASRLRIAGIPGTIQLVSSLLDAGIQQLGQEESGQVAVNSREGSWPWVPQCCRRIKERVYDPEEEPSADQYLFPVLGMLILERLAYDLDNCVEISRATDLIPKIIGFIRYTNDMTDLGEEQQTLAISSSLSLVRRLASAGGKIGVTLRQQMSENPFLLSNLAEILDDSRSGTELWEPAMDIIAKLAMDEDTRQEVGRIHVIVAKLKHAFLGRHASSNTYYYDRSLRTTGGEALSMLAMENTDNCSAILEELGHELIEDLKNMLHNDEYRYVAASLLHNLCAHSRDELRNTGPSEHLSSALPVVLEKTMAAEGKQLEALISLASGICNVIPESFVQALESRLDVKTFIQKLVSELNANKKPSPEFPRMRRVVVELAISMVESCPANATVFRERGLREALCKVEKTPSRVEKYSLFFGNAGVALQRGPPLSTLVARAKELIDAATPQAQPATTHEMI